MEELAPIPLSIKESISNLHLTTSQPTPYRDAVTRTHNNPEATHTPRLTPLGGRIPTPQALPPTPPYPAGDHARASAAIKDRQILLDFEPDHPTLRKNPTKKELIDFIQKAIAKLDTTNGPPIQIKATTTTKNGNMILELNTSEAANWLKVPARKQTFLEHLGGKVQIKDRLYHLVVPFLPIAIRADDPETLRNIERENDLATHVVAKLKWIKDPSRRSARQRMAHALLSVTSPHAANHLIREGIYLDQAKYHPRKDRKEPVRCLKCQRWGHYSSSCTQTRDTCGVCAHEHRDRNCNSFETFRCVNCDTDSHSSRDRSCPEFLRRCAELDARTPDNAMPYFPTDEDWTQVLLPPRPDGPIVHAKPPQPPKDTGRQPLRQQTLGNFPPGRPGTHTTSNPKPPPHASTSTNSRPRSMSSPTETQSIEEEDTQPAEERTTPKRPQPFPAPSPLHKTPRPRNQTTPDERPQPPSTPTPPTDTISPHLPFSPSPPFPGSLPMQNNSSSSANE